MAELSPDKPCNRTAYKTIYNGGDFLIILHIQTNNSACNRTFHK